MDLKERLKDYRILNLEEDGDPDVRDLYLSAALLTFHQQLRLHADRRLEYRISDPRPGDIEQIYASVDKASSVLGWRAGRGIEEAMRDAWRWQCGLAER